MATIGLKDLYYAPITETDGAESYGTPKVLSKALTAELSIEYAEGTLHADDALDENIKVFKSGSLKLGTKDIPDAAAAELFGAKVDGNGVLVSSGGDISTEVAVGFRSLKSNQKGYRHVWLYRVKFSVPSESYATKGDSFEFKTPEIEGVIMQRKTPDSRGKWNWKAAVDSDGAGVKTEVISNWFKEVYEPDFTAEGA